MIEPYDENLVRREVFEDVIEKVQSHAVVAICGSGGCGKSALIWQVLDWLQNSACCTVLAANHVEKSWIRDVVHKWRGLVRNSNDRPETALHRLITANPNSPRPILYLALDGLDEVPVDRESPVREIVKWFWEEERQDSGPPKATLIVSCRRRKDLSRKWLHLVPQLLGGGPEIVFIELKDFSEKEFREITRTKRPELSKRSSLISGPTRDMLEGEYPMEAFGDVFQSNGSIQIDDQVRESLKHPAMWMAFRLLPDIIQIDAISGDQDAVYQLANRFLVWFHWKVELRQPSLSQLDF